MNKEEVEAVLAHEIAHVANGDMVTLTLIQGVTNTFVVFLSRIIGNFADRAVLRNESDAPESVITLHPSCWILFWGFWRLLLLLTSLAIESSELTQALQKIMGKYNTNDQRIGQTWFCSY